MNTDPGFSNRYMAEIEIAGSIIAGRLRARGITEVTLSEVGVDQFESPLAEVRDSVVEDRLATGYELSHSQICGSLVRASHLLNPR